MLPATRRVWQSLRRFCMSEFSPLRPSHCCSRRATLFFAIETEKHTYYMFTKKWIIGLIKYYYFLALIIMPILRTTKNRKTQFHLPPFQWHVFEDLHWWKSEAGFVPSAHFVLHNELKACVITLLQHLNMVLETTKQNTLVILVMSKNSYQDYMQTHTTIFLLFTKWPYLNKKYYEICKTAK